MYSQSPHRPGGQSICGKADLSHPAIRILMGVVLATLLFGGIARLIMKRYEKGDVYPPYSSLRLDPLGTAAFHDALAMQSGITVRRNSEPLDELERMDTPGRPARATILMLGVDPFWVRDADHMATAKRLAAQGNRVVVALRPARGSPPKSSDSAEKKEATSETEERAGKDAEAKPFLELKFLDDPEIDEEEGEHEYFATHALPDVEAALPWFSRVAFSNVDPGWDTVLMLDGDPVGIALQHGEGSILVLGDAYLFSNEALLSDKRPGFLRWCVGGAGEIVFEETHHGLFRQDNVMTLIRKYQLAPAVGVCLLAALFFLWRNALPFPPRARTGTPERSIVGGFDAGSGLLNLLRRSVPPPEVLATCVAEWRSSLPRDTSALRPAQRSALARLEAETNLSPSAQNPISAYNEATRILEKTL